MRALVLASLVIVSLGGRAEGALFQVRSAVHVHTTFSSGSLSPEEVIEEARRLGIDAVILADNFLLRFEYGLFPFRGLLRKVVERPSVMRSGVAEYLQAIEAAQANSPDVILIPGVEVIPHYYWTGSPLFGELTMWDGQKNLLVFGLSRAQDYLQIPATGNGKRLPFGLAGLLRLTLGASTISAGILLLRMKRQRAVQLKHFALKVETRHRLAGWTTVGVGALIVLDVLTLPEINPYRGDLGIAPYQQVIEAVESRGGAVIWSFPQARDFHRFSLGRLGDLVVKTEPYPQALMQSHGYTGFGAVVPDTVTTTDPGREWDQLLLEYTENRRGRPVWGIGELGYHEPPKHLGDVLTVFLVRERSQQAILQALKQGRLYGVYPRPDLTLVLEDFSISQEGKVGWTPMGGDLQTNGQGDLLIRLRIVSREGRAAPFTLRVVRSGKLHQVLEGRTPYSEILRVTPPEPGRREFFRIQITKPHRLLSNPIFVRRDA